MMVTFNRLLCLVTLIKTCEASLTLCDSPQSYLELEEGKQNNTFTCSGLKQTESVEWYLEFPDQPTRPTPIGTCFTNLSCSVQVKTIFNLRRTTETSVITVNETAILNKNTFSTITLLCQTFLQESKTAESRCQVDYIYPAENVACNIEFSGNTWRLTGQCAISKVQSTRNNYGCYLYQKIEGSLESTRVGFYSMDLGPSTSNRYVSGTCNMTSFLPPSERYSYTVIVMPGKISVPATFNGNNTIRIPRLQPSHDCPLYTNEGSTLICSCSVNDSGYPSGILRWNSLSSSQLIFTNLQRQQNGMKSVCTLTWNNTVQQSVFYTLIVAYRPTVANFMLNSIASENVSVVENSTVTMKCEADGRPAPRLTITKVSDNSVLKTAPEGNITVEDQAGEIIYTVQVAQCSDSDKYSCTATNSLGMKDQFVSLLVKCAPRLNKQASSSVSQGKIPYVTFTNKPEEIHFQITALPTPNVLMKLFLGSSNCSDVKTTANDTVVRASCVTQSYSSVICTIIINYVLPQHVGFYEVVIGNNLGELSFTFEVRLTNDKESMCEVLTNQAYSKGMATGLGVGFGVMLGVFLGLFVPTVLWMWRRQWTFSCKKNKGQKPVESISSAEERESASDSRDPLGNTYDALRMKDIGVGSPYSSLDSAKHYKVSNRETVAHIEQEPAYSNPSLT